jgi:glutathione synthase/RimK-type ligase-like ATP-grasp enzyme
MILVISSPGDHHAEAVMAHLEQLHVEARLVDIGLYPYGMFLTAAFDDDRVWEFFLRASDGTAVPLADCQAIWWRRPRAHTIDPRIREPRHRLFAHRESHEALMGVLSSLDVFWVNDPVSESVAAQKIYQLRTAQAVGLPIPRTLVTSEPERARAFVGELGLEQSVYKCFSATREDWRETRLMRSQELDLLDTVRYAPVIFQEYVPADVDLRVTIVGDQTFGAAIHSQGIGYDVDYRMTLGQAEVEPVDLPAAVEQRLRALMRQLNLVYGAIDLRRTPDGVFVFLEINPSGEFLFVEELTGQPIAASIARFLAARAMDRVVGPG